ncbi:MAG: betaine/proline/choline family ABC transporter ATP-binding protein [Bacillota bacterium]
MIRLEQVSKQFPNSVSFAVKELSIHIPKGEICIFVGPSGCGKTTTMKMINRLIEPTKGKIYVNGQDTSQIDPIKLRLGIGYVIQDIGLFPHLTIEQNIATVPLEIGWDKNRIKKRVDYLLRLMDLDPDIYSKKRPSALSGGQKQRVGVARALAADPPIMLMDEPFGALDPITRTKLQDEFLRVQEQIKKTIVFVTHDIDEAIKMGDKIAVMQEGNLVQFGTPDEILQYPANEFVQNLVGGDRTLKRLNLIQCQEVMKSVAVVNCDMGFAEARKAIESHKTETAAVVDNNGTLVGYISLDDLVGEEGKIESVIRQAKTVVDEKTRLKDTLSEMFTVGQRFVFVADQTNKVKGIVGIDDLLEVVSDQ